MRARLFLRAVSLALAFGAMAEPIAPGRIEVVDSDTIQVGARSGRSASSG